MIMRLFIQFLILLFVLWLLRQCWRLLTLPRSSKPVGDEAEELVACAACSTYVPKGKAASAVIADRRRYFCNTDCLETYTSQHKLGG